MVVLLDRAASINKNSLSPPNKPNVKPAIVVKSTPKGFSVKLIHRWLYLQPHY